MNWTDVPAGTINAAQQRLWVALGDDADVVASRINNDGVLVLKESFGIILPHSGVAQR